MYLTRYLIEYELVFKICILQVNLNDEFFSISINRISSSTDSAFAAI